MSDGRHTPCAVAFERHAERGYHSPLTYSPLILLSDQRCLAPVFVSRKGAARGGLWANSNSFGNCKRIGSSVYRPLLNCRPGKVRSIKAVTAGGSAKAGPSTRREIRPASSPPTNRARQGKLAGQRNSTGTSVSS